MRERTPPLHGLLLQHTAKPCNYLTLPISATTADEGWVIAPLRFHRASICVAGLEAAETDGNWLRKESGKRQPINYAGTVWAVSLGTRPARANEDLPQPLGPRSSRNGVPRPAECGPYDREHSLILSCRAEALVLAFKEPNSLSQILSKNPCAKN